MVDFGSAAHGDYFSITDTYDPLSNRRAFYDASHLLPAAMLEATWRSGPRRTLENFLYMLRSGMMGWVTIMQDTNAWTAEQHDAARQAFALYKHQLRPLIRDARLYHVSEPAGRRALGWNGVLGPGARQGRGLRLSRICAGRDGTSVSYWPGSMPQNSYKLHFEDGSAPDRMATGSELMGPGLEVHLHNPLSSELVFLEEAGRARDGR